MSVNNTTTNHQSKIVANVCPTPADFVRAVREYFPEESNYALRNRDDVDDDDDDGGEKEVKGKGKGKGTKRYCGGVDVNRERGGCLLRSVEGYFDGDGMGFVGRGDGDGRKGKGKGGVWRNWGGSVRKVPGDWKVPKNLSQIQGIVRRARRSGRKVRVVGKGFSFSDVFGDDGDVWISMERLKRVVFNGWDSGTVTVQGGAEVGDLKRILIEEGVCVGGMVGMEGVTMGGVIATGGFGGGWDVTDVAGLVVELSVVDAEGRLHIFSKDKDGDVFQAVKVSLGLFGVVYDMTIQVQPMKNVVVKNEFVSQSRFFAKNDSEMSILRLRELVTSRYAVKVVWMPFNSYLDHPGDEWDPYGDDLWIRTLSETNEPVSAEGVSVVWTPISQWFEQNAVEVASEFVLRYVPKFVTIFQATAFNYIKAAPCEFVQTLPDAIHFQEGKEGFRVVSTELALPLIEDKDWGSLHSAWTHVIGLVQDYRAQGKYPLNVSLHCKFCRSSDAFLSPIYSKVPCHFACIEIMSAASTADWHPFMHDVLVFWQTLPGARFHWAKMFPDNSATFIRKSLDGQLERFRDFRRRSDVDPYNMFANDWLTKVLALEDDVTRGDDYFNEGQREKNLLLRKLSTGGYSPKSPRSIAEMNESGDLFFDNAEYEYDTALQELLKAEERADSRAKVMFVVFFLFLYAAVWALLFGREAACWLGIQRLCGLSFDERIPQWMKRATAVVQATLNRW